MTLALDSVVVLALLRLKQDSLAGFLLVSEFRSLRNRVNFFCVNWHKFTDRLQVSVFGDDVLVSCKRLFLDFSEPCKLVELGLRLKAQLFFVVQSF